MSPLRAVKVPVPKASRLIPSVLLLVESTSSKSKVPAPVMSMAGPPVAETLSVPAASTVSVPVWVEKNAAVVPEVVVKAKSVPEPSPRARVPVVAVRPTAPVGEPVTVIASMTLAVPKLVEAPAASSARAPVVVIEIVPAEARLMVPALFNRTPIAPLVETVRSEMFQVPVVASSSRPGWVPAVPVSTMVTSLIVPPASPLPPAMPPPAPCGSMLRPVTVLPAARSMTSAPLSVIVGRSAGLPVCNVTPPTARLAASPISRWLAFSVNPAV